MPNQQDMGMQGYAQPAAQQNYYQQPAVNQGYNQAYDANNAYGYEQNNYAQNNYVQNNYAQNGYAQNQSYGNSNAGTSCPGKEIASLICGIISGVGGVIALICGIVISSEASRLTNSSIWDLISRAYTLDAQLKSELSGAIWGIIFGIMSIPTGIVALALRGKVYRTAQVITGKVKIGFIFGLAGLVLGVVGTILCITGIVRIVEYADSLTRQMNSMSSWW